jgi:hypothetical protein
VERLSGNFFKDGKDRCLTLNKPVAARVILTQFYAENADLMGKSLIRIRG